MLLNEFSAARVSPADLLLVESLESRCSLEEQRTLRAANPGGRF